jgi:hypothetical protein
MLMIFTMGTALAYCTGFEVIKSGVKAFPTPDRITPFWHPDTCSLRLVPKTEGEQETIKGISGGDPR